MKDAIQDEFVRYIYRVQLVRQDEPARPRPQRVVTNQSDGGSVGSASPASAGDKIPRNAPCPCGSGRKYKKCHGLSA
jgi:preprotein translocase subunit SecA